MPDHWITDNGYVHLCVAKGTLVPAKTLRVGHSQGGQATYKRGISNVAPTDSPSSFRPAQVPCSSSSFSSFSIVEASYNRISATASERAELPQLQVQPAVGWIARSASAPAALASSMQSGVPSGLHPMQARLQSGVQGRQEHGLDVPGVQVQVQGQGQGLQGVQGQGQVQGLQDYNMKLREYQTQLQRLHTLQAQLQNLQGREVHGGLHGGLQGGLHNGLQGGLQGGLQSGLQGNFVCAPNPLPCFNISTAVADEEAQMEAQLQLVLFSDEAGSPSPLRSYDSQRAPLSASVAEEAGLQIYSPDCRTPEEFADALLEGDETTDEFGIDMASAIETWKANQAAGGVADESLDVSRASTVCRGLQGLGLDREQMLADELEQAGSLSPAIAASAATDDLQWPMPVSGELEAYSTPDKPSLGRGCRVQCPTRR